MRYVNWGLVNVGIFFAAMIMCAIGVFTDGMIKLVCGVSSVLLVSIGWIMITIRAFKK